MVSIVVIMLVSFIYFCMGSLFFLLFNLLIFDVQGETTVTNLCMGLVADVGDVYDKVSVIQKNTAKLLENQALLVALTKQGGKKREIDRRKNVQT